MSKFYNWLSRFYTWLRGEKETEKESRVWQSPAISISGEVGRVLIVNRFYIPSNIWTGLLVGQLEGAGFEVTQVTDTNEGVGALIKKVGCIEHTFHVIIYNGQRSTIDFLEDSFKKHVREWVPTEDEPVF